MYVTRQGAWRRLLLAEASFAASGSGVGLSRTRVRAKSDCDRAAFDLDCGKTAAGASWLDAVRIWNVRTLTAGLRVSPSLAAAGFQEIRPVSGVLASIGRCVTGIKRADTASVEQCSMSGDPALGRKGLLHVLSGSRA